jgi:hypothetical protein
VKITEVKKTTRGSLEIDRVHLFFMQLINNRIIQTPERSSPFYYSSNTGYKLFFGPTEKQIFQIEYHREDIPDEDIKAGWYINVPLGRDDVDSIRVTEDILKHIELFKLWSKN